MIKKYNKLIISCVVVGVFYFFFQHHTSFDDVKFSEMADIYGANVALYQYFEGSWYPLFQLIYLFSVNAEEFFAFLFFLIFALWAIKIHGFFLGLIISIIATIMLGTSRPEPNSSLGLLSRSHWIFLITGLLFMTQDKISKWQSVYLCATTLVSGLPGILFPVVAITKGGIKKGIYLFVCVVLYMLARNILPVADLTDMQSGLSRNTDFDITVYFGVFFIQGVMGYLPIGLDQLKLSAANLVMTPAILLIPYMLFWLPLVGFFGGFRYGIAVIWSSICCMIFSMAPEKTHMLLYPNHGHYLHWVGFALVMGFCVWTFKHFRLDALIDSIKGATKWQ